MKIDKTATVPLYAQVEAVLEERISAGVWEEGYQIPTERELAATLEVSNITVKRAIMNLVDKGMLVRQRGKGTFVTYRHQEKNIHKSEFITMDAQLGSTHEMLANENHVTNRGIAKKLEIDEDTQFVYIERLGYEDGEVISLEYTFIPQKFWPEGSSSIDKDAFIYDVLQEKCGITLKRSKNFFSGAVANEKEIRLLGVRLNTPLFVLERITYSTSGEPVEYSKFVMKQDKEKYYMEIELE